MYKDLYNKCLVFCCMNFEYFFPTFLNHTTVNYMFPKSERKKHIKIPIKNPQNTNRTSQIKLITAEYDYIDDPNEFYDSLLSVLKEIPQTKQQQKPKRQQTWSFELMFFFLS